MDPIIQQLVIKRFRSIPVEVVRFSNPTFLVGRNGSGKSNLVDVFAFLADAMAVPLQAVFDVRGGIAAVRNRTSGGQSYPPNLGIRIEFGTLNGDIAKGHYAFEIRAVQNYGFEVFREQCVVTQPDGNRRWFDRTTQALFRSDAGAAQPHLDHAALTLPVIGGEKVFAPVVKALSTMKVYAIEPTKLRGMQDPDSGTSLRNDGSNAASVLQEIQRVSKDDWDQIREKLAAIVPNTSKVSPKKHGNKLSLEFAQEWDVGGKKKKLSFESFNMSDGTLRALGLLVAVYQKPAPSLLVIEEPEATIHPGALGAVLDLLKHASRFMQVIVTTHSPDILDADWLTDDHLRIVDWQNGATRINRLAEAPKTILRDHLMGAGELLRTNALNPEPSPLFTDHSSLSQLGLFEDLRP